MSLNHMVAHTLLMNQRIEVCLVPGTRTDKNAILPMI